MISITNNGRKGYSDVLSRRDEFEFVTPREREKEMKPDGDYLEFLFFVGLLTSPGKCRDYLQSKTLGIYFQLYSGGLKCGGG